MRTRIETREVVGTLKAAGLMASILGKRERRPGFKVTRVNPIAVAVRHHAWGDVLGADFAGESAKLEAIPVAAGFRVERPFLDKAILGVTKQPS